MGFLGERNRSRLCLFVAACKSQNSTTSPTSTGVGLAQTEAQGGTELPFRGSFTGGIDVPPPSARGTVEGTATQLGRFTGTVAAEVNPDASSTGTFNLTAANGDQLSGTFVGQGVSIPPNQARITEVATIENGTGRFAGATGTFTMVSLHTIISPRDGDWYWNLRRTDQQIKVPLRMRADSMHG